MIRPCSDFAVLLSAVYNSICWIKRAILPEYSEMPCDFATANKSKTPSEACETRALQVRTQQHRVIVMRPEQAGAQGPTQGAKQRQGRRPNRTGACFIGENTPDKRWASAARQHNTPCGLKSIGPPESIVPFLPAEPRQITSPNSAAPRWERRVCA